MKGKGLIQHTFPMPDGGGLRLTVAEYLTPSLHHVTNVGRAQYDSYGNYVGGGVLPDIYCESRGIPTNPGADLCIDKAIDVLNSIDGVQHRKTANLFTTGIIKVIYLLIQFHFRDHY